MDSRRIVLDSVQITALPGVNAGLLFDKYLPQQHKSGEGKYRELVDATAAQSRPSDLYREFFKRWEKQLDQLGALCAPAKTDGRLAVGIGGSSVIESGITLHRTYGLPLIPGSALKGLASSYAHLYLERAAWRKGDAAHTVVFGDTASAGYVTFFDALCIPANERTLYADVLAIHHSDYYSGKRDAAPADWDDPVVVPFLSASGSFLVAVAGPVPWREAALDILKLALAQVGVGAKTAAGYGRMTLQGDWRSHLQPPDARDSATMTVAPRGDDGTSEATEPDNPYQVEVEEFRRSLPGLEHRKAMEQWRSSELPEPYRQEMARAIISHRRIGMNSRQRKQYKASDFYQELAATLPADDPARI